ncbi:MAG: SusF/SusE family outer membrane protein [Cyclobacteriaceae bacterium]
MKKTIKLLGLLMSITTLAYFSSCSDDEPTIDIGDDDVIVSDGFYVIGGSAPSETPAASGILSLGIVEDENFATKNRANYYETYLYLDANGGGVQFASYLNNEATVYGGSTETVDYGDDSNNDTPMGAFLKGALTEDGAAVTPTQSGLHHVVVDLSSKIFLVIPVNTWGAIGPATAGGWGADTDIATISADGLTYSSDDLVLRDGTMKFRYNDGWKIDMRTDPTAGFDDANGFVALTNFGGTIDNLEQGGGDFAAPEEGTYEISITFSNGQIVPSVTTNRTGDAPELAFDADDYTWGLIGAATATGWDADTELVYNGKDDAGVHKWTGVFHLAAGEFKFRSDDSWTNEIGVGNATLSGDAVGSISGDNNFVFDGTATAYYFQITTVEDPIEWKVEISEAVWEIIGDATPTGWDSGTAMTRSEDGSTWTITADMTAASYKFRANSAWDYNIGGDAAGLTYNGDNLSIGEDGNYTVTLTTADSGVTYTTSAAKN